MVMYKSVEKCLHDDFWKNRTVIEKSLHGKRGVVEKCLHEHVEKCLQVL